MQFSQSATGISYSGKGKREMFEYFRDQTTFSLGQLLSQLLYHFFIKLNLMVCVVYNCWWLKISVCFEAASILPRMLLHACAPASAEFA